MVVRKTKHTCHNKCVSKTACPLTLITLAYQRARFGLCVSSSSQSEPGFGSPQVRAPNAVGPLSLSSRCRLLGSTPALVNLCLATLTCWVGLDLYRPSVDVGLKPSGTGPLRHSAWTRRTSLIMTPPDHKRTRSTRAFSRKHGPSAIPLPITPSLHRMSMIQHRISTIQPGHWNWWERVERRIFPPGRWNFR